MMSKKKNKTRLHVAIDGTVASGKGTVAKMLANRLGIICLGTGALYRGITIHFMNKKIDLSCEAQIEFALKSLDLRVCHEQGSTLIILDGKDITQWLEETEVSNLVYKIAAIPCVRAKVRAIQNDIAEKNDLVCEGRDITSVVLPNAQFKFYLTASLEVRAERRFLQERINNMDITVEDVMMAIHERDVADMARSISPLIHVYDAVLIDATNVTAAEVVDKMMEIIKEK